MSEFLSTRKRRRLDSRDAFFFSSGAILGVVMASSFVLSFALGASQDLGFADMTDAHWLSDFFEVADEDHSGSLGAIEVELAAGRFRSFADQLDQAPGGGLFPGGAPQSQLAVDRFVLELLANEPATDHRHRMGKLPDGAAPPAAGTSAPKADEEPRPPAEPPEAGRQGVFEESSERAMLLLCLMLIQSGSAMVLARYEDFLKDHHVVVIFLTMLVGAGGNVGNQSVIQTIEDLIRGHIQPDAKGCIESLMRQLSVGTALAAILGAGGFLRAYMTQYYFRAPGSDGRHALRECVAITIALMVIVLTSAVLGTTMPFGFAAVGLDVVHAGPTIQVVMDIGGVVITCAIAHSLLRHKPAALTGSQKVHVHC